MLPRRIGLGLFWIYVGLVLAFLYAPLVPPFVFSFTEKSAGIGAFTLDWYAGLAESAAAIFGFVGAFGESAVPIILGGVGYQLMGNTITSSMDVLNYPLAAAMSSVVVALMLLLLVAWFAVFDIRSFLGKILRWRY